MDINFLPNYKDKDPLAYFKKIFEENNLLKIYKNQELEDFCQKIKKLRDDWNNLFEPTIYNTMPSASIITTIDCSSKFSCDPIKVTLHLAHSTTCKNIISRLNESNFETILNMKENSIEIELSVDINKHPAQIITQALEAFYTSPNIKDLISRLKVEILDPSRYVLRIKDLDEYLLYDIPLNQYNVVHKNLIDYKSVHFELVSINNQNLAHKNLPHIQSEEIFNIAVNMLNENNDLICKHPLIKEKIGKIKSLLCSLKSIHVTEKKSASLSYLAKLSINDTDDSPTQSTVKRTVSEHKNSPINSPSRSASQNKALVQDLIQQLSTFYILIRNFSTKKFFYSFESLKHVKIGQNEIPSSSILNVITCELAKIIEIYYKNMHCDHKILFNELLPPTDSELVKLYNLSKKETVSPIDNLQIQILQLFNLHELHFHEFSSYSVKAELIYCSRSINISKMSEKADKKVYFDGIIEFNRPLTFNITVSSLREEMGLLITLNGYKDNQEKLVAAGYLKLYDLNHKLVSGDLLIGLIPIDTCDKLKLLCRSMELNKIPQKYPILHILMPEVDYNSLKNTDPCLLKSSSKTRAKTYFDEKDILKIINNLSAIVTMQNYNQIPLENAQKLWEHRTKIGNLKINFNVTLLLIASAIIDSASDQEISDFLKSIPPLTSYEYLLLIGPHFSNRVVRTFAIEYISKFDQDTFCDSVQILINCLAFESDLWCTFMCLLIQRSWDNPQIAHNIFWSCKSLSEDLFAANHFVTLMAVILASYTTQERNNLLLQLSITNKIFDCGKVVQTLQTNDEKVEYLHTVLTKINQDLNQNFNLPISYTAKVNGIAVKKCKVFSSASSPILVNYVNSYPCGLHVPVIYKVGDVLLRDMVTIFIFRRLYKLWFVGGINFKMRTYDVLPTSEFEGMLEVVPEVTPMAAIHALSGLTGTFNPDSIIDWIKSHNKTKKEYLDAIHNFLFSCAGYCVATYVLGICDRHNDNILLSKSGHIFHIDFNKYLGDAQMFLGFKRDRAPFVLTSDMLAVINEYNTSDQTGFQIFCEKCCIAYQMARKNSHLIFNIINLMLASDPNVDECLEYVYDRLKIGITENEAFMEFYKLIQISSNTLFTQVNFFIHNLAQRKNRPSKSDKLEEKSKKLFIFCDTEATYSIKSDGKISKIVAVDHIHDKSADKVPATLLIFKVERAGSQKGYIYRSITDLIGLFLKLSEVDKFNKLKYEFLANVEFNKKGFIKKEYLYDIIKEVNLLMCKLLESNVGESPMVYTWCHAYSFDELHINNYTPNYPKSGNTENQYPEIKISFKRNNDKFSVLLTTIKNFKLLNINCDSELQIKLKSLPSNHVQKSKKQAVTSDALFLISFELPYYSVVSLDKHITLTLLASKLFASRPIGTVNVPIQDIDVDAVEGRWYKIDPL